MSDKSSLELVQMYADLLRHEQKRLNECLENIAEYGEKLSQAAEADRDEGLAPMTAQVEPTVDQMREMISSAVGVCKSIDADWAAGRRSMPRAETWAIAKAAVEMWRAIELNDAVAFQKAANEARERAFPAMIHARNWVREQAALNTSEG